MNGYCGECDEQIELNEVTVIKGGKGNGVIGVYLQCPWCEDIELITKVDID